MTGTEKVLQRKDSSSLIVAIVLGLATLQFVGAIAGALSSKILTQDSAVPSGSFQDQYVTPLLMLVLEVVAVEILVWLVILVRGFAYATPAKKKK